MSTALPDPKGSSDAELIASVREGRIEAYGTLYERHVAAAYNLARQLTRSATESDDLVSEAFAKVLDALRAGKGPDSAFRAYLLTTLRHVAYDRARKDRRVDLTADITSVEEGVDALKVPFTDTAVRGLERSLAAKAFGRLPERWQTVLWHTEIERQSPAEVAPLLGLTPNGVSALAYRAREGLRQAYLQAHLAETEQQRCRATVSRLGAWTRHALSRRERAQVEAHLDRCPRCGALAAELADVNSALRAVVAPLVLGGLVADYLATTGAGAAKELAAQPPATESSASPGDTTDAGTAIAPASPRQFVGVAGSGVAMAAAIAIALAAGGVSPPLAQRPPSATQVPTPPSSQQPLPEPGPVPPLLPPATSAPLIPSLPATRTPPLPTAPSTSRPAEEPAPGPARVVLREHVSELVLEADGAPAELPFTVRNEGESTSSGVKLTLRLPPGISAVAPGGGGGSPQGHVAGEPVGTARTPTGGHDINCPAGTGTVTCERGGLAPGESAVFRLWLRAAGNAEAGRITGSLGLGASKRADISVPLTVRAGDVAELETEKLLGERPRALSVEVRNGGRSPRRARVEFDRPGMAFPRGGALNCDSGNRPRCSPLRPLRPGESFRMLYVPYRDQRHVLELTVSATVGHARVTETVEFACGYGHCARDEVPQRGGPGSEEPTTGDAEPPSAPHLREVLPPVVRQRPVEGLLGG
ncbi:RNA polymerase sigma factor (sigma-70 family) [Saccharomonospora amisosensis]|uniref:RNA polymerase sigma factor (Sigma-70 family) n=1 Tax=Saccharomonospora amisosensis TaxID=1128677 RepID=A0A7X5ZSX3_9PSEU|nr:sigma-70 family RNA polymerase sigma factor [Saccharomonospora amisosensis]NIJ14021.1 RNA polymerase sigma factor (sigma-70 family) [Saccharomonospora amisosensis]